MGKGQPAPEQMDFRWQRVRGTRSSEFSNSPLTYGCEANAKTGPHFAAIPLAFKNTNFEARTHSYVTKANLDSRGQRAVSVTCLDAGAREFEQPASLFPKDICFNRFMSVGALGV